MSISPYVNNLTPKEFIDDLCFSNFADKKLYIHPKDKNSLGFVTIPKLSHWQSLKLSFTQIIHPISKEPYALGPLAKKREWEVLFINGNDVDINGSKNKSDSLKFLFNFISKNISTIIKIANEGDKSLLTRNIEHLQSYFCENLYGKELEQAKTTFKNIFDIAKASQIEYHRKNHDFKSKDKIKLPLFLRQLSYQGIFGNRFFKKWNFFGTNIAGKKFNFFGLNFAGKKLGFNGFNIVGVNRDFQIINKNGDYKVYATSRSFFDREISSEQKLALAENLYKLIKNNSLYIRHVRLNTEGVIENLENIRTRLKKELSEEEKDQVDAYFTNARSRLEKIGKKIEKDKSHDIFEGFKTVTNNIFIGIPTRVIKELSGSVKNAVDTSFEESLDPFTPDKSEMILPI